MAIATSAACLVFSQVASTSSMLICPITCGSLHSPPGTAKLICPSQSSANISWKSVCKKSSISSSVSICPYRSSSSSGSSSWEICKYGISSTIFLILSIVSVTVSLESASKICCIPFASSSCKFKVLKRPEDAVRSGIFTVS